MHVVIVWVHERHLSADTRGDRYNLLGGMRIKTVYWAQYHTLPKAWPARELHAL